MAGNLKLMLTKWESGDHSAKDALVRRVAFRVFSVAKLNTKNGENPWLIDGKVYAFTTDSYLKNWQTKNLKECTSTHITGQEISKHFKNCEVTIRIDEGESHAATLSDDIVKLILAAKMKEVEAVEIVQRTPPPQPVTYQPQYIEQAMPQEAVYTSTAVDTYGGTYIQQPLEPQFIPVEQEETYIREQEEFLPNEDLTETLEQLPEQQIQEEIPQVNLIEQQPEPFVEQEQKPIVEQRQQQDLLTNQPASTSLTAVPVDPTVQLIQPQLDLTETPQQTLIQIPPLESDTSILQRETILGYPSEQQQPQSLQDSLQGI